MITTPTLRSPFNIYAAPDKLVRPFLFVQYETRLDFLAFLGTISVYLLRTEAVICLRDSIPDILAKCLRMKLNAIQLLLRNRKRLRTAKLPGTMFHRSTPKTFRAQRSVQRIPDSFEAYRAAYKFKWRLGFEAASISRLLIVERKKETIILDPL
jgi:hypothetical protein